MGKIRLYSAIVTSCLNKGNVINNDSIIECIEMFKATLNKFNDYLQQVSTQKIQKIKQSENERIPLINSEQFETIQKVLISIGCLGIDPNVA